VENRQRKSNSGESISPEAVEQYLKSHPEFFERRGDLLARLSVPHQTGSAVSLVQRQVSILRDQNTALERKLVDLMEVARANDRVIQQLHSLSVALIGARDLPVAMAVLMDGMREQFKADQVVLILHQPNDALEPADDVRFVDADDAGLEEFSGFRASSRPQCGRLRDPQLEFLFGDTGGRAKSTALIPLGADAELGMLALGSKDKDRFVPTMGTEYLARLGEMTAACLDG
jgi:uncharacterized protein YigA (DUF484 family)